MATHLSDCGSILLLTDFIPGSLPLYESLLSSISWDTRIRARKSMSFGLPYNYSGIEWPGAPLPDPIIQVLSRVAAEVGFEPNNCLANYYPDGQSTMGFHSDSTAELEPGTGIAVVSLGAERTIAFRRMDDKTVTESYPLLSGSLLWMCLEMQAQWKHAILGDATARGGRISLTFRQMRTETKCWNSSFERNQEMARDQRPNKAKKNKYADPKTGQFRHTDGDRRHRRGASAKDAIKNKKLLREAGGSEPDSPAECDDAESGSQDAAEAAAHKLRQGDWEAAMTRSHQVALS